MKKILTGVIILLLVLLLGSYYGMGLLTENSIKKTLQDIQATKGIVLQVKSYHRGFFASEAELQWVIHLAERQFTDKVGQLQKLPEQDYLLPIALSIHHGPLMFTQSGLKMGLGYATGTLMLPNEYHQQLRSFFDNTDQVPHVQLSLLFNFLNQANIKVSIPQFQLESKQVQTDINWKGLNSQAKLSLNLNHMSGSAQLDGFVLNKAANQLAVGSVESDYKFRKTVLGLYTGNAHFKLDSLKLSSQNRSSFAIKKLAISSSNGVNKGIFDSEMMGSVEEVTLGEKQYGPGSVTISLKNLDAEVLAKINHELQSIQNQSNTIKQKTFLSVLPQLPGLLSKGPVLSISGLSVHIPQGDINGELTVSLPRSDNTASTFQLLTQIHGTGHLSMPVSVVTDLMSNVVRSKLQHPVTTNNSSDQADPSLAQASSQSVSSTPSNVNMMAGESFENQVNTMTSQRLALLLQSGVLIQKGNEYILDVVLEHGALQVNGKPFTPAMLEF